MSQTVWRTEDVGADAARWVVSPAGRRVLDHLLSDTSDDALAVATRLRGMGLAPEQAATAQGVAAASRRAWDDGHPPGSWWTPAAAEQASAPDVAAWRARRYTGAATVDVTAGCGGDALALAGVADDLVAAELSSARLPFLRANLPASVAVVQSDATRPCLRPARRLAWADPGRRPGGRRVRRLGDTAPPIDALVAPGWHGLGIAVSPAVDLADPDRPDDAELEFVQVGRRLVEATLWLGATRDTGPGERAEASATLLPDGLHLRGIPSAPSGRVAPIGAWLVEPAPALVRARLVDEVAEDLGLTRLARHRALFTSSHPPTSPWFHGEAVEAVVTPRPGRVRDALRALDDQPIELVTHGVQVDPDAWWRGLGSPARGPRGRAVHVARLDDATVAVVTRRDAHA